MLIYSDKPSTSSRLWRCFSSHSPARLDVKLALCSLHGFLHCSSSENHTRLCRGLASSAKRKNSSWDVSSLSRVTFALFVVACENRFSAEPVGTLMQDSCSVNFRSGAILRKDNRFLHLRCMPTRHVYFWNETPNQSNFFRFLYWLDGSHLVLPYTVTSTNKAMYSTSGAPRFSVLSESRAPVAVRIGRRFAVLCRPR